MDLGFLVLCPDRKPGGLQNTINSIKSYSWNRQVIATTEDSVNKEELAELKKHCPCFAGGKTFTSLINEGIKKSKTDWVFVLFSGSRIPSYIESKIENFLHDEKNVLFPVVDRKGDFVSGSFNGVLFNRNFFLKVGDFPEINFEHEKFNDFEVAKLLWAIEGLKHNVKFKAIVGMKII